MRVTFILSLALVIVFRPFAAVEVSPNSQCIVNSTLTPMLDGDRLDDPMWRDGEGVRTRSDCSLNCSVSSDEHGRPCVAIEWSDGGSVLPSTESRECAFAWACDGTKEWGGGSVYWIAPTTSPSNVPTVNPTLRPSVIPSVSPSAHPSASPTSTPTDQPSSSSPTTDPTAPSDVSSTSTTHLILRLTSDPTTRPTRDPTNAPSLSPSSPPSLYPSAASPLDDTKLWNSSFAIPIVIILTVVLCVVAVCLFVMYRNRRGGVRYGEIGRATIEVPGVAR